MVDTENKKFQRFVEQCVKFCKSAGLTTQQSIYEWLNNDLQNDYKGRAPKWKIESVAEDITESICLKLNIKQKGIR